MENQKDFLEKIIKATGPKKIRHHDCGICGYDTGYLFGVNNIVFFDSGCFCTKGYNPERRSTQDFLDFLKRFKINLDNINEFIIEIDPVRFPLFPIEKKTGQQN